MVGASREMVSRVMKDLEDRGFIETREDGSMLVKDRLTHAGVMAQPATSPPARPAQRICTARVRAASSLRLSSARRMTYSLNTLTDRAPAGAPPARRPGPLRPRNRAGARRRGARVLAAGAGSAIPRRTPPSPPPATAAPVRNWGGRLGAWLADAQLLPARLLGLVVRRRRRARLAGLAGALDARRRSRADRRPHALAARPRSRSGSAWPCCCAPAPALEWSRLYRFEARLPDHAGGALGYLVGPAGVKWLGFTGSGLVFVALVVLGVGAGVPLLLEPRGRAHGRRHRRLHRVAPREARDRRGPGAGPAGRARARGDRAGRAHRDRGTPSRRRC